MILFALLLQACSDTPASPAPVEPAQPEPPPPKTEPAASAKPSFDELTLLFAARDLDGVIARADVLAPGGAFRARTRAHLMKGDLPGALRELDLGRLRGGGYPANLTDATFPEGYYKGWNSLAIEAGSLVIDDATGQRLATLPLGRELPRAPSDWSREDLNLLLNLAHAWEADHAYCCASKFLVRGYAPGDAVLLAELEVLDGHAADAEELLALVRAVDWEGSLTEFEWPSVFTALIAHPKRAQALADAVYAARYGEPEDAFLRLALAANTPAFDAASVAFDAALAAAPQVESPYDRWDGMHEQPLVDAWIAGLPAGAQASTLRRAWTAVKARHSMGDVYAWMYADR